MLSKLRKIVALLARMMKHSFPVHRAVAFFDDLATNASLHNVSVIIYAGNDDTVVPHFSSESAL